MHGSGGVADVLRALKHPEGQAVEEVPGRQQARNWAELETSLLWKEQRQLAFKPFGMEMEVSLSLIVHALNSGCCG